MPSVAKSAEQTTAIKQSSGDVPVDAQSKLQQFVDKKIRNLEKRKMKLIQLREDLEKGVHIDDEQKLAVKKFDTVVELIEFLREFHKHLTDTFAEHNKLQKTIEKKEKLERKQQELDRLKAIIGYQDILGRFEETVKNDFRNGVKGAIKLTDEQLSHLDEFYNFTTLNANGGEPTADQAAERWIALAEGRSREAFSGVTFKDLKELLQNISECSYFQPNNTAATTAEPTNTNTVTVTKDEDEHSQLFAKESDDSNALKNTNSLIFQSNTPEIMKMTNQFASGISFMRDSSLESELQHKDPAVVAVSNSGFPYQFNMQTNDGIVVGQLNNIPNANTSSMNSSQKVNAYENVNQLSSIPTQTFTNQNFTTLIPSIVPVTIAGQPIAVQQIVPQDFSPHAVTSSEMIAGQQNFNNVQNFNHHFIDSMHDSKAITSQESSVFQNSDDSGGYRNNSKTRTRGQRPHQGSQGNVNGYSGRQRNGNKGFHANSYNSYQHTNGTSYGNNNYDRNAHNNLNRGSGNRNASRGGPNGRPDRGQNATQFKA